MIVVSTLALLSSFPYGIIGGMKGEEFETELRVQAAPLSPVKLSPKRFTDKDIPFEFEWLVEGYGKPFPTLGSQLRFRVFSQERKTQTEVAEPATKLLLALWNLSRQRLKLDHKPDYNRSCVDVYLCWAGEPGGEQLFDQDLQTPRGQNDKVNTIYIYDLPSFKDPVERVREIAHEYGHALLHPAVGGFEEPENWANGYFGEKLFMMWLADSMKPEDEYMGAKAADIQGWVKKFCTPLVTAGASTAPNALGGKDGAAMNRYIGAMLWLHMILPNDAFARTIKLVENNKATSVPKATLMAVEGVGAYTVTVPKSLVGKEIWFPVGTGTLTGATIKSKLNGWFKIVATAKPLKVNW